MDADRQAHLARVAEHIDSVESTLRDLRSRVAARRDNTKAQELASDIEEKVRTARHRLAACEASSSTEWTTSRQELSNLMGDISVDIGCLRVACRQLETAAPTR